MAVRCRWWRCRRGRFYSRNRSGHTVYFFAGWLRGGLPFLLNRAPRFQPQPQHRRNCGAALVCRALFAQTPGAIHPGDLQRGDDGHGRAAAKLRSPGSGPAGYVERPRLRPFATPRDGLDLRRGSHDGPAGPRLPGGLGGVLACTRRSFAQPACAAEPQVPAGGITGCLRALPGVRAARFHYPRVLHARWCQ